MDMTTGLRFPKARAAKLERDKKRAVRKDTDEAENKKVRARSGGRCEVYEAGQLRCRHHASQIHHMFGGWRTRARGRSALSEHKQHICTTCHCDITSHVLERIGDATPHWTNPYRRVAMEMK